MKQIEPAVIARAAGEAARQATDSAFAVAQATAWMVNKDKKRPGYQSNTRDPQVRVAQNPTRHPPVRLPKTAPNSRASMRQVSLDSIFCRVLTRDQTVSDPNPSPVALPIECELEEQHAQMPHPSDIQANGTRVRGLRARTPAALQPSQEAEECRHISSPAQADTSTSNVIVDHAANQSDDDLIFCGYWSDMSDDVEDYQILEKDGEDVGESWLDERTENIPSVPSPPSPDSPGVHPLSIDPVLLAIDGPLTTSELGPSAPKRRRLEVPVRTAHALKKAEMNKRKQLALVAIHKQIISRKTEFEAGDHGLQARRARSVETALHLMVNEKKSFMEASRIAAVAHRFKEGWGSRLVRSWTVHWINERVLPSSERGAHAKVSSILSDPIVRAEIRDYMRSHKWALSPPKLQRFLDNELEKGEAQEYVKVLVSQEMPQGLRAYLEGTLLPRFQLKPGKLGLSLSSMRRLLLREGFTFTEHKKALYFDGHERPDVVEDRQNRFIPAMLAVRPKLQKRVLEWRAICEAGKH